jgi:hypothetical protein
MQEAQAPMIHTPFRADATVPVITVPLGTPLSAVAKELILSMLGICTKTLYNRLREYGVRDTHGSARSWAAPSPVSTSVRSVETSSARSVETA